MALELLSGPHLVTDLATEAAFDTGHSLLRYRNQWVDPFGLIVLGADQLRHVFQMDGSACTYGEVYGIGSRNLSLALLGADPSNPSVGEKWYSESFGFDESALTRITKVPDRDNVVSSDLPSMARAHVHDRFLRTSVTHVQFALGASGGYTTEATVAGFNATTGDGFSWAREANEIWCADGHGMVFRYNYATKEVTSPVYSIGMTCLNLFYSAKHDVFISLHNADSPHYMRVWARTPLPASISAPTATPAIKAGLVSTLRCRVLGDAGEACPDEVVAWSLTGDGILIADTSTTDENGYAEAQIVMPLDASGDVQVDVEVAY